MQRNVVPDHYLSDYLNSQAIFHTRVPFGLEHGAKPPGRFRTRSERSETVI